MDTLTVIGALAGVITTLGGAVAMLYRAQVQGLKDQCANLEKQIGERRAGEEFWRDKYFQQEARTDKALESLDKAVQAIKTVTGRRGQAG